MSNNIFLKFYFDFLLSIIGLIILTPFLLVIALLIKSKMGSPVFFIQNRVGLNGNLFKMIKFRTMILGHSSSSVSIAGEARITTLGKWLRKYKLDELPELINVLKGEMSIVGPRPDVPGYSDLLVGEERNILKLKPGITGPASLKYRNEENILAKQENPIQYNDDVIFPDKVKINLEYYYNNNILIDLKIIFKTFFR